MSWIRVAICFIIAYACIFFHTTALAYRCLHPDLSAQLLYLYTRIHAHPEPSLYEIQTSRLIAAELRLAGCRIIYGVGGYGVVGILKNGPGPTIMYRADMDAVRASQNPGAFADKTAGVLLSDRVCHACGHDIHSTILVGAARVLAARKNEWRGTAVFVAQPAEEIGIGARAMIDAGLFKMMGRPAAILGLHVSAHLPVGTLAYTPGRNSAYTSRLIIEIAPRSRYANPQAILNALSKGIRSQFPDDATRSIVMSDATPFPQSAHIGTRAPYHTNAGYDNQTVAIRLSVRSLNTIYHHMQSIREISLFSRILVHSLDYSARITPGKNITPAGYNDPVLTARAVSFLKPLLGNQNVIRIDPGFYGDDFSRYGIAARAPALMLVLGAVDTRQHAYATYHNKPLPPLHSTDFAPDAFGTITTGVNAISDLIIHLMK